MKTAKDLIIPFSWHERRPILLDRFFYLPAEYEYREEKLSFFSNEQPIVIEYCSGNGQWIGERAKENPHLNWLAVEKKFERARKIWLKSYRENLPNLAVACAEAEVFTRYYAPQSVSCFVNFPDPWPKFRHRKHRLVQARFLMEVAQKIAPGGKITCVTDDAAYANQMLAEFEKCPEWKLLFHRNEWPGYGDSFFNDLWQQKGKTIHYMSYEISS